ncbi:BTAD domain-containing putative transcriptional regulator [Streptomyces sp. NPDC058623]|uniref:AfsR/SARP family transcriptional regulator n=1 Tax=Streptomyces sp. NPDC058623 TaxID=3346563 RepID=UPI003658FB6C
MAAEQEIADFERSRRPARNTSGPVPDAVLEFRTLGPLEVRLDGRSLPLGGPRQRAVLSVLLLSPNRVVSFDSLIEKVWDGRPPSTARTQVAICIAALRKAFRAAGCERETIVTAPPGYMLSLSGHTLDSLCFEQLVHRSAGWAAASRHAEAEGALREALSLWRGPALGGVYAQFVESEATRLDEQRLLAVEQHMALRLQLGEHHALLGELRVLVSTNPLRDRLRFYLMLAQYRAGRRAEALNTFREGTRHSIEEIGLELSVELQMLHDSILRDELPHPAVPGFPAAPAKPERLPASRMPEDDPLFTGHARERSVMDDVLLSAAARGDAPIAYLTGSPGIGKSSLAVHWAHRSAARFPDGLLFADLRDGTEAVLHGFLRRLGATGPLPSDVEEAARMYRARLEGKRVLLVLDHAVSYARVRPLLPGGGGSCVLITGRAGLDELLQAHSALVLRIGPLSAGESGQLLAGVLRDRRAEESPEAVRRLGELCGHMPLALRAAAAKLLTKQHWHVSDLVRRLEKSADCLDELSIGEDSLRARLDDSVAELQPEAACAYQRLSELDGGEFTVPQAASVLSTGAADAEDLIEILVDAQLLDPVGRSPWGEMSYRWQELIRLHAVHSRAASPRAADLVF